MILREISFVLVILLFMAIAFGFLVDLTANYKKINKNNKKKQKTNINNTYYD